MTYSLPPPKLFKLPTPSIDIEVVFEDDVLRDRATILLRGSKFDLSRRADCLLGQTVGQSLDDADIGYTA